MEITATQGEINNEIIPLTRIHQHLKRLAIANMPQSTFTPALDCADRRAQRIACPTFRCSEHPLSVNSKSMSTHLWWLVNNVHSVRSRVISQTWSFERNYWCFIEEATNKSENFLRAVWDSLEICSIKVVYPANISLFFLPLTTPGFIANEYIHILCQYQNYRIMDIHI